MDIDGGERGEPVKEKTRIVEIGGTNYQFRKMLPEIGSYLLMKLLSAGFNAQGGANLENPHANSEAAAQPDADKREPSGEKLVRAVAFAAFLRGLDFESHRFVQRACLAVCSRMEERNGSGALPMPLMNDSGAWAIPEIRDDIPLIMKLELEALAFNLSDFFEQGGLNALAGAVPK